MIASIFTLIGAPLLCPALTVVATDPVLASPADLANVGLLVPKGREVALLSPVSTLSDLAADFVEPKGKFVGWRQFFEINGANYRNAETDDKAGRASLDRFGVSFEAERHTKTGSVWEMGLSYDSLNYDVGFSLASLPLGVTSADSWRASTAYHSPGSKVFSCYAGARAEAGAARGVYAWETINLGGSLGLNWRVLDGLDFTLSFDGYERPEENFRAVILPIIEWQISDELRLGPVAGGYGLDYEWDSATHYFANVSYDERSIRLNDEVAPADWVLRDSERSVRLGMLWEPKKAVELILQAGLAERDLVVAYQDQVFDRVHLEPEAFIGVRLIFGRGSIF